VVECCLDREWSNGGTVTIRGKSAVRGVQPAALPLRPSRPGNDPQAPRCGKSDYLLTLCWIYSSKMGVILDHLFSVTCSYAGRPFDGRVESDGSVGRIYRNYRTAPFNVISQRGVPVLRN
jgi:hypothetical protein